MADTSLTIIPAESPSSALALAPAPHDGGTVIGATLAAQVEATVKARYSIAQMRPRDLDVVRQRVLKNCRRPSFAEMALYKKPVGGGKFVEGESIRFAEAAALAMGNITTEVIAVDEDDKRRTLRVISVDIETNVSFSTDVAVQKTVERRFVKEGQTVISSRRNSTGDIVHLVEATEDDMLTKSGNAISKAMRNNIMRLVPGDIVDDAIAECRKTLAAGTKADPDAERNRILDKFGEFNVLPTDLKDYLGHDVGQGQVSLAELADLRKVYSAISTQETTWPEVMKEKAEALGKAAPAAPAARDAAEAVRQKLEKKA